MQTNLLLLTIPDCRPVIKSSINFCGVSKALETKYSVLRQKLLVDCLRIRMGTDQLEAMSQNDKQQKVMILDNRAVEQIQIGKIMPSLLGEGFHLQVTVTQMMGLCKHVFQNTVKGQQVIGSAKTKENLDQLLLTFCIDYQKFSGSVTPALVDLMSGQVTRAMQLVLKDSLVNYLVNVVHKHLFATITNCMKRNDSNLNKKNPNLVETRLVHLHMRARVRGEFAGLTERAVQAERLQYASRASTVLQTCRDASYEACGSCKK
ncbi:uncharacterized protein LOC127843887 isoform X2 [Dreissena polymorpha]|uniref:uncharacterized protein LOC127843887 isoform X2 n=1 Tax=Dreissena polymorpha TaxID=45954 RepID=UPI0022647585|nr:uncharacterized protein LOC127843887 isoform X2 [Dreissena polymorpha]